MLDEETADQRTLLRSILMTASASQMAVKQQQKQNKGQQTAYRHYLTFVQNKIFLKRVAKFL
jgi:hypothetical protein